MEQEGSGEPAASARQLLVEWANEQDHWVRAIVGDVLATRQPVTERALDEAYARLLAEKQLSGDPLTPVPPLGIPSEDTAIAETLRIKQLSAVRDVNALVNDQEIAFNDRVTICFGETGAGKTGYVRIFKRLAGVRSAEQILRNIHGIGSPTPHAIITYAHAGAEAQHDWNDEAGVTPFTRISVFDSRAAALHVDENLTYFYTPSDLALFAHAHSAIDDVKQRLERATAEASPRGNPFLPRFNRDTPVYPKIEALSAATDIAELERLAAITAEERESLQALREKVEALRPDASQARLRLARTDQDTFTTLENAARIATAFPFQAYEESLTALARANQRLQEATEQAFTPEEVPAGFTDEWKAFLAAGEAYLESLDQHDYPHENDACIFCRQPLTTSALALLRKYRDFSRGELRDAVEQAKQTLARIMQPLASLDVRGIRTTLEQRATDLPDNALLKESSQLIKDICVLQEVLIRQEPVSAGDLADRTSRIADLAHAQVTQAVELIGTLTLEATERERLFQAETSNLRTLEARITLQTLLAEIKAHVEKAQWAAKAGVLTTTRFPPILRSLTEESKRASEQLLNQDFETRFGQECTALRAPRVSLDFPGRRGEPTRRKTLDADHQLSEILSEGEQKVIALADFLAEASLRHTSAPLIFDDPITSLDHKRMRYVADRLCELSAENQVIVFTHNIWFVVELMARFEKTPTECSYYEICQEDGGIGIVRPTPGGPKWDTPGAIRARINTVLGQAEQARGEERAALIERGYSLIRSWSETFFEQEVLCGVTQRFQPHVRMTVLNQIKADRLPSVIDTVLPIFEKACRLTEAHSQPLETLGTRATLEELKEDWAKLQAARSAYMDRQPASG